MAPTGWGFSGVGASGRLDGYCRSCTIQARFISYKENGLGEMTIPTGRMGNGGVLENGGGQLGVCHTTGCRSDPPLNLCDILQCNSCPGVTLVMHLLVDPRESLISTIAVTVTTFLSSSPQSPIWVPTFTQVRSWNPLQCLIATVRSLQGMLAGRHQKD